MLRDNTAEHLLNPTSIHTQSTHSQSWMTAVKPWQPDAARRPCLTAVQLHKRKYRIRFYHAATALSRCIAAGKHASIGSIGPSTVVGLVR